MLLNCSVREDAWESLGLQEDKPGDPKGNQSWIFIERNDAEAETPILWPLNAKKWLIGKHPDAGKDWRQEKGITEDKIVGWHHPLNGHVFEQAPGIGDGQGSLACCSPWGRKESDTTERLTWTELPSLCGFFFVFGCGISFFGGFQHPSVEGCSTSSCSFGVLAGGDERTSFYSTILSQKPEISYVFRLKSVF